MYSNSLFKKKLEALSASESLVFLGAVNLKGQEPQYLLFENWINLGKQGGLDYLNKNKHLRKEPNKIFEGAQSSLVFGFSCYDGDRLNFKSWKNPRVAQYARFYNYHKILKKKGCKVLEQLQEFDKEIKGRVLVDSAPVLERALASRTSKGFIGKNNMYIHPIYGSYLLLMEIFLNKAIEEDKPAKIDVKSRSKNGGCGSCRRCEVHCPTGALTSYSLDARKCISYYTIEHRGCIPVEYWKYLKLYLYGCDICQLSCPYNRKIDFRQTEFRWDKNPSLYEIVKMTQSEYEYFFGGTPMTRAKRVGLRRNALIAMVVCGDKRLDLVIKDILLEKDPILEGTINQIDEFLKIEKSKNGE